MSASTPADNTTVSFLDLPAELRNKVYGELLPDVEPWYMFPGKSLRVDGQTSSTNFMATCHQLHDEAAGMLYGSRELEVFVSRTGEINFLNQEVDFADVSNANFSALNQIKVLRLEVSANDSVAVCDIQDALFALFSHLTPNHKLHTLEAHIDVSTHHDYGYELFNLRYGERMFRQNVMREFRNVRPGHISRAHMAAFLTDRLRTIRNLRDGGKKGKFTLDFVGKSGRPWKDIQGQIRDLVHGDSPVLDYKVFSAYFEVLRALRLVIEWFNIGAKESRDFKSEATKLGRARIRGDNASLKQGHKALLSIADLIIATELENSHALSHEEAELCEQRIREACYLMQELEAALPGDDVDTSFLGYNEADAGLREWQTTGRAQAKADKAERKRKRGKEAKSTSSKKAKTSKDD